MATKSDAGPADDELLRVSQVARALGVTVGTIRAWIRKGAMRAKRVGPGGHLIRVSRAELQRHVQDDGDR